MTKTIDERIDEIKRGVIIETCGFKTEPRNEVAEIIILEFLKSQPWVAQKALFIINELQKENQTIKDMHAADAEGAKVIIAEMEEEIRKLKEELSKEKKRGDIYREKWLEVSEDQEKLMNKLESCKSVMNAIKSDTTDKTVSSLLHNFFILTENQEKHTKSPE